MALQFEKGKSSSIDKFELALEAFQNKVLDDAVLKSKEWFGKSKLSREVAEAMMYPILKHPKKKDGSGEPDYDRSPTLKLKVSFWEDKFNMELYDMGRRAIYLPLDTARRLGVEPPQGSRGPVELLPKAAHVKGLLACTGVWMAGGRFGVTWRFMQGCVRPPVRLVGAGQCHVADDSDDDEMSENLHKYDASKVVDDDVVAPNKEAAPSFVDTDEEDTQGAVDGSGAESGTESGTESVETAEVTERPVTPPPAPRKKKIVRRRKAVKKTT